MQIFLAINQVSNQIFKGVHLDTYHQISQRAEEKSNESVEDMDGTLRGGSAWYRGPKSASSEIIQNKEHFY